MHNELDYRFGVRDIYFLGRRHLHLNCEENIYSAIYMRNQVLTWNTIINYVMHMSCKSIENENLNAW